MWQVLPPPLLSKKVQPLVDPPAVTVKKTGARTNAPAITNPVPETGGTTVRSLAAPTAAHPDVERDGAAVAGGIVARLLAVAPIPAARSAPLGPAAATATAAVATLRATATTALRGAGAATRSVHRTPSMRDGEAEDEDGLGGVSIHLLPLRTRVLARGATAATRGTDGTTTAALVALAAGAVAPVEGLGGAVTAAAVALPAAPRLRTKALHIVVGLGAELTVTHTVESLIALVSTAPSHHEQPPHAALTGMHIHPVHRCRDPAAPEMLES